MNQKGFLFLNHTIDIDCIIRSAGEGKIPFPAVTWSSSGGELI